MSESGGAARPLTTWEYCLSIADELVLARSPADRERQAQVVVLLAAVVAGCADGAGLDGARVGEVPLHGPDSAAVVLAAGARIALRACPAVPGRGGEEREVLLALDRAAFAPVQADAEAVLAVHLPPAGTARTVREAAAASYRGRRLHDVARALGIDEED